MRDRVGSIIGAARYPTSSAASGLWTLREQESARRLTAWPSFQVPLSISGLQLWYDFSDMNNIRNNSNVVPTASGQSVYPLDKSGNSRDLTLYSSYPTIIYPDQNGLPSANGMGWLYRNDYSFLSFVHSSASTVFFAFRPGTASNPNTTYYLFGTNNQNAQSLDNTGFQFFWADAGGQGRDNAVGFISARSDAGSPTAINYTSNGSVMANAWSYVCHVGDMTNATASERSKFFINGGSVQANNTFTAAAAGSGHSSPLFFGNNGFAGRFGEMLIYNRVLTTTEIAAMNQYLAGKWGI
jgi:hypothetical protein